MFCTKCGTNNEDTNTYCKSCGAKLVKSATNNAGSQSVSGNSGVAQAAKPVNIILIAGVAIIAVFIVSGLLFWRKGSNSKVVNTTAVSKEDVSYEIPKQTPSQTKTGSYVPGIYSSTLLLGNMNVELQVTVDKDSIGSINLTNLDERVTTVYPLLRPTLSELSAVILSEQSIENISYGDENRYTSMLLMQAISEALDKANGEGNDTSKIGDLDFTVLGEDQQPDSLKDMIAEKSADSFQISYTRADDLYIAVGYGEQSSGGYSICVNALYETANTLVIDTALISPDKAENVTKIPTRPYIVVKTKNVTDKTIEFK